MTKKPFIFVATLFLIAACNVNEARKARKTSTLTGAKPEMTDKTAQPEVIPAAAPKAPAETPSESSTPSAANKPAPSTSTGPSTDSSTNRVVHSQTTPTGQDVKPSTQGTQVAVVNQDIKPNIDPAAFQPHTVAVESMRMTSQEVQEEVIGLNAKKLLLASAGGNNRPDNVCTFGVEFNTSKEAILAHIRIAVAGQSSARFRLGLSSLPEKTYDITTDGGDELLQVIDQSSGELQRLTIRYKVTTNTATKMKTRLATAVYAEVNPGQTGAEVITCVPSSNAKAIETASK